MSMSVNLIAILVSLAMMLTGAGGAGQPAETSKTLLIHNAVVTYNDQTVNLAPALRLSASTDGEKAVYALGVDLNGETLLPIQLGADENGITALFEKTGVSARVTADALQSAIDQVVAPLQAMMAQAQQGEQSELVSFLMNEYIPAYAGLMEAVQDKDYQKQLQEKSNAIFDRIVDRGEGTPVTELVEGDETALTAYSYKLDAAQLSDLMEELFASDPVLENYYKAMFRMYSMMPEESGMQGIASYRDLFEKTGLQLELDINEKRSESGDVVLTEATLTLDMNAMIAATATEGADVPQLPPMVIYIDSSEVSGQTDATVIFNYQFDEAGIDLVAHGSQGEGNNGMDMLFNMQQEGQQLATLSLSAYQEDAGNGAAYSYLNYSFDVADQGGLTMNISCNSAADGTSKSNVSLAGQVGENAVGLSFDCDVLADAVTDAVNGIEPTVTLSDLSEEAMNALGEDATFAGALMQAVGSLQTDVQQLMADESVQQLVTLLQNTDSNSHDRVSQIPSDDGAEYDYAFDIEDGEEYEDVEDDGVLGFDVPQFTWIPEGWSEQERFEDTAFDWATVSLGSDDGNDGLYASFYADNESQQRNYVLGDDGKLTLVEGRLVTLNDFGENGIALSVHEGDVFASISFFNSDIDMETISQIVAGMKF